MPSVTDKTDINPDCELAQIPTSEMEGEVFERNFGHLHRRLGNRHIQLLAIGGSIGTVLFISIGGVLSNGGPANLLLGYTSYCLLMSLINNSTAEMTIYMPISGGFVRFAGAWVDDAFGFMAGWNYFFYQALIASFEITALNLVFTFWTDKIPVAAVCAGTIVLYALINLFSVRIFGETEFWLSSGKVILIGMLFMFTIITMCGGNPQNDAYGFRNWSGGFVAYRSSGGTGRFEGYLQVVWNAVFTIVGPENISMAAAEVKHPRTYLKSAYKTIYWRYGVFFIGSAFCVGTIIPYNHPTLMEIYHGDGSGSGTGAASPYVIAMNELGVSVLPHIVNALIATSIFSAGNAYVYAATRSLYGLAVAKRAPAFMKRCTASGVPIYCLGTTMLFPMLSFLQVSNSTNTVLNWLISLVTGGCIINFLVILVTYSRFYKACVAQGFDRSKLPYRGWFQPYGNYVALFLMGTICICIGYTSFSPFDVQSFFIWYAMLIVAVILFSAWKIIHKTKLISVTELDLIWQAPAIDAYEASTSDRCNTFWREMFELVAIWKRFPNSKS